MLIQPMTTITMMLIVLCRNAIPDAEYARMVMCMRTVMRIMMAVVITIAIAPLCFGALPHSTSVCCTAHSKVDSLLKHQYESRLPSKESIRKCILQ